MLKNKIVVYTEYLYRISIIIYICQEDDYSLVSPPFVLF